VPPPHPPPRCMVTRAGSRERLRASSNDAHVKPVTTRSAVPLQRAHAGDTPGAGRGGGDSRDRLPREELYRAPPDAARARGLPAPSFTTTSGGAERHLSDARATRWETGASDLSMADNRLRRQRWCGRLDADRRARRARASPSTGGWTRSPTPNDDDVGQARAGSGRGRADGGHADRGIGKQITTTTGSNRVFSPPPRCSPALASRAGARRRLRARDGARRMGARRQGETSTSRRLVGRTWTPALNLIRGEDKIRAAEDPPPRGAAAARSAGLESCLRTPARGGWTSTPRGSDTAPI